jgi:predicted nuclease with TOPRIM domain
VKTRRVGELEQENAQLNSEIEYNHAKLRKLKGVLSIKDDMFQEFQNLVLVSNNKFKKLEESNSGNNSSLIISTYL